MEKSYVIKEFRMLWNYRNKNKLNNKNLKLLICNLRDIKQKKLDYKDLREYIINKNSSRIGRSLHDLLLYMEQGELEEAKGEVNYIVSLY
jgi:hypothetical protein